MEYVKPTLVHAGAAQTLVLGPKIGTGDHVPPQNSGLSRPVALALGLDD
jgi:hypothetical protein